MTNMMLLGVSILLLAGLLYFDKQDSRTGKLFTKTPLSMLFVLAALLQSHPNPAYYHGLLYGLVLCLCGDVLLVFPDKRWFLAGLVAFLLGHVFYGVSFFAISQISPAAWGAGGVVLVISMTVFFWLKPHLGSMKVPVVFYVIIITVMVFGAASILFDASLPGAGRYMVCAGALFFYFSDLFVARDRFVTKGFLNRLIGLPLYYIGQFLLAFSTGWI